MDFVYRPDGAKERRWRWAPQKTKLAEAELVEELTGDLFWEWVNNVVAGSMKAAHVLIFLRLRDEIPDVDYDTIDFSPGEIGWDLDDEEVGAAMRRLEERAETEPLSEADESQLAVFRERLGVVASVPKDERADVQHVAAPSEPDLLDLSHKTVLPSSVSSTAAVASSGISPTS